MPQPSLKPPIHNEDEDDREENDFKDRPHTERSWHSVINNCFGAIITERLKKKHSIVCVWSYWIVCFSGSVALAMFTANCTKPLDLLPVNGQNWPNLYFYSPILIAAGISLLKMTPTKGSQKLPSRPINHQILDVLHICAFLSCFLGSGCLTAGTIFHISLHTALMSLCTRLTWPRDWHQVSSTYIMKALNA